MANKVLQTFTANGSWVCPADVFVVNVITKKNAPGLPSGGWTAAGGNMLAMDSFGNAYAWGVNTEGELGVGDQVARSSPVAVLGGINFRSLCQGGDSNFGIAQNGAAYGWGFNTSGSLGVGVGLAGTFSSPIAVLGGLTFQKLISVFGTAGSPITFGLTPAGNLYGWGYNGDGGLGVGDVVPRSSPVAVLGGFQFTQVLSVFDSTYGLSQSGVAYAWGVNTLGQLGVGDVTPRSSPVAVLGGLTFASIAASIDSAFGITAAGAAYGWGGNTNGGLGVGDVIPRSSPVAVLGGLKFASIVSSANASVNYFTLGLTTAGKLYAWGLNTDGQLGVGDVTPRSSPVAVLGGLTFQSVYVGLTDSVYALTTDGVLYAWGSNPKGQLGVGDIIPRSSPVAVLGGLVFKTLSVGTFTGSVYALTQNGVMYAWGNNLHGELGVGDVVARSSPVAVLGGLLFSMKNELASKSVSVVPGTTYTIAIQQFNASFGTHVLGANSVDSLTLEYDQ